MTPKQIPAGPVVQAIVVQDGDMRLTVSATDIEIVRIGPQGGTSKPPYRMKAEEVERLIRLLQLARRQQETFSASLA